ncbi:Ppx/GppA phosphatase family-domain-containing protein [Piptocephalis cylindrospora]|uniref:Ppx/GppA phosphatase family-domain-containing protein n=1 Tax=Piptocephalis cylindrospora TaxID=1907219 RepID=A0A4P9Y2Q3_9FUNG|nr:Ppx/GppA phosphatase family-domain-containing protein [Piptocephalis cylindrospora]|eukprot:RKP12090.1 Ppx/GppA phosphatase family-domain-containing protein [Piptocephalis cylindrospora]
MPQPIQPFAVVDVGSNGIRFTIFSAKERHLPVLYRERVGISLFKEKKPSGDGEDRTLTLPKEALERVGMAFTRLKRLTVEAGVQETLVVGTETVRLLGNEEDLTRIIQEASGWSLQALSSADEARYGALGVIATTGASSGIIVDLGGGSVQCSHLTLSHDSESPGSTSPKVQVGWPVRSLPYGAAAVMARLEEARLDGLEKKRSRRGSKGSSWAILSGFKGLRKNSQESKGTSPSPPSPPSPQDPSESDEDVSLVMEKAVKHSLLQLMDTWGMVEAMPIPTNPHRDGEETHPTDETKREEEGETDETTKDTVIIPKRCYLTGGGGRAMGYLIMHVTNAPLKLIEGWTLPISTVLEYMDGWDKDVRKGVAPRGLPPVQRILGVSKRRLAQLPAILLILGQVLSVLRDRGVREVSWSMGGMREGLAYGKLLSSQERLVESPVLSTLQAWLKVHGGGIVAPVEARALVRTIQSDLHLQLHHPRRSLGGMLSLEEQPTVHVMEMAIQLSQLGSSLPPDNEEARSRYAASFFLSDGEGASWNGLEHRERVALAIILSSRWSKICPIDPDTLTLLDPIEQGRCQGIGRILSLILSTCPTSLDPILAGRTRLSWEVQEGDGKVKKDGTRKRRVLLTTLDKEESPKSSIAIPW